MLELCHILLLFQLALLVLQFARVSPAGGANLFQFWFVGVIGRFFSLGFSLGLSLFLEFCSQSLVPGVHVLRKLAVPLDGLGPQLGLGSETLTHGEELAMRWRRDAMRRTETPDRKPMHLHTDAHTRPHRHPITSTNACLHTAQPAPQRRHQSARHVPATRAPPPLCRRRPVTNFSLLREVLLCATF